MRVTLLSCLILCLSAGSLAFGKPVPDSCKVIILSELVGGVISAAAGEKYSLFEQFKGFTQAVVVELPDSSCAVLFTFVSGAGLRDSLVRSTWPAIVRTAERIEHFQELENGEYVMGSSPVRLRYSSPGVRGSAEFVPPGDLSSAPAILSWRETEATGNDSIGLKWPARLSHNAEDALPLTGGPRLSMPPRYPCLAFAVGLRTISPDFSGLNGGALGPNNVSFWHLFNIIPELLITSEIGIQIDLGLSSIECTTSGATLVLYTHPFDDKNVRPFLEAGGVWTYIHTNLSGEGDPSIYLKTSAGGVRGGIGIEYMLENSMGIVLDISYEHVAKISDVFTEYSFTMSGSFPPVVPVSVDLSGVRFGIRLKFQ